MAIYCRLVIVITYACSREVSTYSVNVFESVDAHAAVATHIRILNVLLLFLLFVHAECPKKTFSLDFESWQHCKSKQNIINLLQFPVRYIGSNWRRLYFK